MKFGISNVFVLCAVLLSVDTFAAPLQVINARDESTLAVRAPPKKAPVVAAPKKPAAVPKKAPVAAAPKKAPVPAAPKKAPVVAAPKKAPAPAAPKKAPVPATPKKAPVPAAPKKAPVAAPKPSVPAASCAFTPKSKIAKPKTIKGRVVATTQFHATCRNFATSIQAAVQGGKFALQPERIWPNEFTWSGGFYVTPDEDKAELFGATFLADKCADKGGVVIMKFSLNQSALQVKEVSSTEVNKFRTAHGQLGQAIQRFLKKQKAADTTPPDPPVDENISTDDNPAVQKPLIALPTPDQLNTIIATANSLSPLKNKQAELLKTLDDFKTVDVVAGAGPLTASQRVSIEDAGQVGIPPLKEPFNQVVLVTDKAMKALTFVSQADLQKCLADQQPALVAFLKKKAAANP